ncbi:TetR family regulatory protein [Corynebacterium vitaeruminis DSM 20294]|uniref:TetR family regulatory protein n=1 Tax=Corynebacterium vitaeruminis DSM 20294 TaxID=1224164 RepID=W5YA33_9CORY|nr:TetR family regulatory protein [Corynebacterium vitaeruminis DSM 20294]
MKDLISDEREPQAESAASTEIDHNEVCPDTVLDIAMQHFAADGFADTKLENIAKESGMSKRMIHYHFGDKRGLYNRCLAKAVTYLRPTQEEVQLDTTVPVEGIRQIVEALFRCFVVHPEAVRLLVMENLHHFGKVTDRRILSDKSEVILQLDKLLMKGQDSGAFRPGISAQDVFTLIVSIAVFRISNRSITMNLYGVDTMDEENTAGMARLASDATLAFLTSNLKSTSDAVSYLTVSLGTETELIDESDSTYDISGTVFE